MGLFNSYDEDWTQEYLSTTVNLEPKSIIDKVKRIVIANPAIWAEAQKCNINNAITFLKSLDDVQLKNFITNAYAKGLPIIKILCEPAKKETDKYFNYLMNPLLTIALTIPAFETIEFARGLLDKNAHPLFALLLRMEPSHLNATSDFSLLGRACSKLTLDNLLIEIHMGAPSIFENLIERLPHSYYTLTQIIPMVKERCTLSKSMIKKLYHYSPTLFALFFDLTLQPPVYGKYPIEEVVFDEASIIWNAVKDYLIEHPDKTIAIAQAKPTTAVIYLDWIRNETQLKKMLSNIKQDELFFTPIVKLIMGKTTKSNELFQHLLNAMTEEALLAELLNSNFELFIFLIKKNHKDLAQKLFDKLKITHYASMIIGLVSNRTHSASIQDQIFSFINDCPNEEQLHQLVNEFPASLHSLFNWLAQANQFKMFTEIYANLPLQLKTKEARKFSFETWKKLIQQDNVNVFAQIDEFLKNSFAQNTTEILKLNIDLYTNMLQILCANQNLFGLAQALYLCSPESFEPVYNDYFNFINERIMKNAITVDGQTIQAASLFPKMKAWRDSPKVFFEMAEKNKIPAIYYLKLFFHEEEDMRIFIKNGQIEYDSKFFEKIINFFEEHTPEFIVNIINAMDLSIALDFSGWDKSAQLYLTGFLSHQLSYKRFDLIEAIIRRIDLNELNCIFSYQAFMHNLTHNIPSSLADLLLEKSKMIENKDVFCQYISTMLAKQLINLPDSSPVIFKFIHHFEFGLDLQGILEKAFANTISQFANNLPAKKEALISLIGILRILMYKSFALMDLVMPKTEQSFQDILMPLLAANEPDLAVQIYQISPDFFHQHKNSFDQTLAIMLRRGLIGSYNRMPLAPPPIASAPPAYSATPGYYDPETQETIFFMGYQRKAYITINESDEKRLIPSFFNIS